MGFFDDNLEFKLQTQKSGTMEQSTPTAYGRTETVRTRLRVSPLASKADTFAGNGNVSFVPGGDALRDIGSTEFEALNAGGLLGVAWRRSSPLNASNDPEGSGHGSSQTCVHENKDDIYTPRIPHGSKDRG